jgi:hypothetical protein
MKSDYTFSRYVNHFIDSLQKHNDTILVEKISDTETIIYWEDWAEHPPIKNYNGRFGEYKRTVEQRERMGESKRGKPKSTETKEKISKSMKDKPRLLSAAASYKQSRRMKENNPSKYVKKTNKSKDT